MKIVFLKILNFFLLFFFFSCQVFFLKAKSINEKNDSTLQNKHSFFINIASGIWTDNFDRGTEQIDKFSRFQYPNFRLNLEWDIKTDFIKRWRLGFTNSVYKFHRFISHNDPYDIYSGSEDIKHYYLVGLNSLWEYSLNTLHKNNIFFLWGIEYSYLYRATNSGWVYYKESFYSKYNVPSKVFLEPQNISGVRWYHQYYVQLLFRFEYHFLQKVEKELISGFETRIPFFFLYHGHSRTMIYDKYFLDIFIAIKL